MTTESKIESVLFFKNEPVSVKELVNILKLNKEEILKSLKNLEDSYKDRGIVLVSDGEYFAFGTHQESSGFIQDLQKEELSRELGRAGLETLAIVLYRGPISRREIDHIRGVNSSFILRTLLVRGLIERTEGQERSYTYKPTLKLLEYLGVSKIEVLPQLKEVGEKVEEFMKTSNIEDIE